MAEPLVAINVTRGVRLTESARIANTIWTRLVGLLNDKEPLKPGDGLWIMPCNSIHCMWMRFDIDAIFLDKHLKVVHLVHVIKPWRISKMVFSAHSVLELPAGLIAQTGTQMGDQFEMNR